MKRLLKQQDAERQAYYKFLVHQSFVELSRSEDHFKAQQFPSSAASLFRSAEFFWKALTILTPREYFSETHEADKKDIMKISHDLLSSEERSKVYWILTHFPEIRRTLAIYGHYEMGKTTRSPYDIFTKSDVEQDLGQVRELSDILKRIHYYQVSEAPVEIGVLSGYIDGPDGESRCCDYPYAGYRSSDDWIRDLAEHVASNKKIFKPVPIHISDLNTGQVPIVVNPFGETIPEKKDSMNIGFDTICEYVRNGGIFINVAGHPFFYGWDVTNNRRETMVPPIPSIAGIRIRHERGNLKLEAVDGMSIPLQDMSLTRTFHLAAAWDIPPTVEGPKEVQVNPCIKNSGLSQDGVTATIFRPLKPTQDIVPLLQAETTYWGKVYPAAATAYGRGALVCFGLTLDGEREYKIAVDVITAMTMQGFQILL
jgi:hypothetical protein